MDIKKTSEEIHQLENVNIFAAIVFTDKDEYISQVLSTSSKDNHYTDALNAITGNKLFVFSIMLDHGKYDFPKTKPGEMAFMCMTWREPINNSPFLKQFELKNSENLPLILFWCFDEKGMLFKRELHLTTKYSNTEEAYLDLKKYLTEVSETIDFINPENIQSLNVYRNVNHTLDTLEMKKNIVETFEKLTKIYRIFKFLNPKG